MSPTFVMTSAWWLEATPQASWQLIADADGWPKWWRSIREVCGTQRRIEDMDRAPIWRAMLGLRLSLRVRPRASEPCELIEWQIHGDICAKMTWVVVGASSGGCDVTCRWEVKLTSDGSEWLRASTCVLLEHSHFVRMRACARDMGSALGCRSARLRVWSGSTRR